MEPAVHLERYDILEEVGQGGMAVVYRAWDKSLDREVALKVLHPHLAHREDHRKRFHREARAVARLHHPNIVEIYDYSGSDSDQAYLVTQFIPGETLRSFLESQGPLLPEIAAMLGVSLASALIHAHGSGVIHRDIKPENVMVCKDGSVILTDFGLAQIVDTHDLTVTGTIVGSPAHMSPEHIEGKELDERADIFSLGTVLYLLCTGRYPFDASNAQALFRLILEGSYTPAIMVRPEVGSPFDQIIAKTLSKNPDDRQQSASILRDELVAYLDLFGIHPPEKHLKDYLQDPSTGASVVEAVVVESLLERANRKLQQGKVAKAMAFYDRLVAMRPDEPRVHAALKDVYKRAQRRRFTMVMVVLVALVALLGLFHVKGIPDLSSPLPKPEETPEISPLQRVEERQEQEEMLPPPQQKAEVATAVAGSGGDEHAQGETETKSQEHGEKLTSSSPSRGENRIAPIYRKEQALSPSAAKLTRDKETGGKLSKRVSKHFPKHLPKEPSRQKGPARSSSQDAPGEQSAKDKVWFAIRSYPYSTIFVNGKESGVTTIDRGVHLDPGAHTIELKNPGCHPHQQTVEVGNGEVSPPGLAVRLRWLPARLIVPHPHNADVYLDNQPLGKTSSTAFSIPMKGPQQNVRLRIKRDVDVLWDEQVTLRPGQATTIGISEQTGR